MSGEVVYIGNEIEDSYPLSPMQQGMLFHNLSAASPGVDVEQLVCDLKEELDRAKFERAWDQVVARHAVLRTAFRWAGLDQPVQEVYRRVELDWIRQDWRGLPGERVEHRLESYLEEDRRRGFAMDRAPMMRFALFWISPHHYRFVWTFHHALMDGRSFPAVLKEVFAQYEALRGGEILNLPAPASYRAHIDWLQRQDWSQAENFWRRTLRGFNQPTPLVVDRKWNLQPPTPIRGAQELRLAAATTAKLQRLASENHFTFNTILQGAWALVLSRYSGQPDVLFGATRACRRSSGAEAESTVGLFINTLPVRVRMDPSRRLLSWLRELRQQWLAMRDYEHTPLVKVQSWSEVPSASPLFESLVVFENFALDSALRAQGNGWSSRRFSLLEQTNFPLTLAAYADSELLLRIQFDRRRLDDDAVARMIGHLRTLLEAFAGRPNATLRDLSIVTEAERHRLLKEWSARRVESHPSTTLHELFEAQTERTPHAVAVVCEGEQLTYRELNRRANCLAHHLRECGVGPEILVGICLERSLELIVGLLAILKAGGAYVPIDLSYPADRVAFILQDTEAPVLLTHSRLLSRLPKHPAKMICVDEFQRDALAVASDELGLAREWSGEPAKSQTRTPAEENLTSGVRAENLAYVIYTSGSTGLPKGVLITHHNAVRLFQATDDWFGFHRTDTWTFFHSHAFDFSVWEIWGALLYGGKLVVVPYLLSRAPEEFYELLSRERVTVLNQTPSAFRQLIHAESRAAASKAPPLRLVIFGGEALEMENLRPWFNRQGDQKPRLVNMFGITETTVHVTYRPLAQSDLASGSRIGIPILDLDVYVLDEELQPAPIGVPGELYVGGAGLGRGYLHRPELTAERFIPHPFSAEPGARLYKTGDLARWLPERDLEYLGRRDDQVKIRGFRVELGEIESVLAEHPAVREAVVLAREEDPGDKRLVAFLAAHETAPTANDLRNFLREKLPEYMVPAAFISLPAFPLTANGKIDRKTLAGMEVRQTEDETEFEPPRTPLERTIAQIWERVLGVPKVGLDGNFFELGGNSLLIIQVHDKLRSALEKNFPITKLFQYPTVRALSRYLGDLPDAKPDLAKARQRAQRHAESVARQKQLAEEIK